MQNMHVWAIFREFNVLFLLHNAHLYVKFNATGSSSQQLQIETPLKRPFCEKAQFREKTFCLVPEAKRKWKCKNSRYVNIRRKRDKFSIEVKRAHLALSPFPMSFFISHSHYNHDYWKSFLRKRCCQQNQKKRNTCSYEKQLLLTRKRKSIKLKKKVRMLSCKIGYPPSLHLG